MNNKMKLMATLTVLAMLMIGMMPLIEGDDAAVGDGGSYSYTITYDSSAMSSTSAAISVDGMTAIDSPSYSGGTVSGYGSWTWDTTTGLGPFNSYYGAFDAANGNAFVAVLNPFNLMETIDGEDISSNAAHYNIMWVLPTVYWSATSTSLTLTNDSTAGGTAYAHTIDGHTYNYIAYGVYEASTYDLNGTTVLTSTSGSTPTVSQTRAVFRDQANNYTMDASLSDSNYNSYSMLWNFYQWELYKYCSWTLMEDFNSQNTVGNGPVYYTNTYQWTTGATDTSGPYAGNPGSITDSTTLASYGADSVKLFIENAWGGVNDFVDGVVVNARSGLYVDTSSTPTDANSAGTYVTYLSRSLMSANGYATSIMTDANTWGFQTGSASGSATTGVADYSYTSTSADRVLYVGGYANTSADYAVRFGLSYWDASDSLSYSDTNCGARLAFVFDASLASTGCSVALEINDDSYGSVDVDSFSVAQDSVITVSGNTITIDGTTVTATPTTATAQYTYAFSSWSVSNGDIVSDDMTITATFTRTLNAYDITIQSSNTDYGTVSTASLSNIDYGTSITVSDNTITIGSTTITATPTTATAQYTYALSSWSVSNGATVTGDLTITATFTQTLNDYDISFVIASGSTGYGTVSTAAVLDVDYGTTITVSGNTITVGSTTVTATAATSGAQYTYAFSGWSPGSGTVTGDQTFTATFTRTLNAYDITIQSSNTDYGTVSPASLSDIDYGTTITVSDNTLTIDGNTITATPTTATAQYTYALSSWSVSNGATVTGDLTITATFTQTVNTYDVDIMSSNTDYGTVDVGSIPGTPYGSTINLSGDNDNILTLTNILTNTSTVVTATVADPDTYYTYSFDGYTNSGVLVQDGDIITGNTSIIANFSSNIHTVIITPSNSEWGSVSLTEIIGVPTGEEAVTNGNEITIYNSTSTATPVASTAQYTYSFAGWTVNGEEIVSPMEITTDITITAEFERTINTYEILWKSNDGTTTLETDSAVQYGAQPTYDGNTPTQSATTEYTYTFAGWATQTEQTSGTAAADLPTVTGAATYYAAFSVTANIVFEVASESEGYGTVSESALAVALDSTYEIDGSTLTVGGNTVTASATTDTAQYIYAFSGWSVEDGDTVTPGETVTATFTRNVAEYTVRIPGATPSQVTDVPYGTEISVNGTSLTINGTTVTATVESLFYEFGSWSVEDGDVVTGDMTITYSVNEQGPGIKGLVGALPIIIIVAILLGVVGTAFMMREQMDMTYLIKLIIGATIAIIVVVFVLLPYVS